MINFGAYDLLAVDPGNTESGHVWIRDGKIALHGVVENREMLRGIDQFCRAVRDYNREPVIAIEVMEPRGMPTSREEMQTMLWVGRFIERSEDGWHVTPWHVNRQKVKLHICGVTNAKDKNVRQAMLDRWGPQGTKANPGPTYGIHSHIWAALAVASYAIDNPLEPKT